MECRACSGTKLTLLLNFGDCFLAGNYPKTLSESKDAAKFPLQVYTCNDCGILQIGTLPNIQHIFHEEYSYRTGNIPSLVNHFAEYSDFVSGFLPDGSSILEFGSNDGTLLSFLHEKNYIVSGFEASLNMVELSTEKGFKTYHGFFGQNSVFLPDKSFDAITCSNVYAHAHNVRTLTKEVFRLLKDGGKFFIEVHDADALLESEFDAIYHEHCVYYSMDTLHHHLNENGFEVLKSVKTSMHGSGLRFVAQKKEQSQHSMANIAAIVQKQKNEAKEIQTRIDAISNFISTLVESNTTVDLYGVAGKTQMLVHHVKLDRFIKNAFDDSELRQDRYIVGTSTKITEFTPQNLSQVAIIGAWNYAEHITKKIKPYYPHIYTLIPEIKKW